MSIFNHFPNINLTSDQTNALQKLQRFLESDNYIFMLKGYAGSGKTTLLQGLVEYLKTKHRTFQVMAPTGRASKILRQKTGYGSTIHKSIYKLKDVDFRKKKKKDDDEDYKLIFPVLKLEDKQNHILIVDEASMISSRKSEHPLFQFGTDILLQDLLTYAQCKTLKTKIIFVGDPAQLPPVGDNKSWAFEPSLFTSKELSVCEAELKQVVRQTDNNILKNATLIRSKIEEEKPNKLSLNFDNQSFINLNIEGVTSQYTDLFPIPQLKNGVVISFSNTQCYHYNNAIREVYFPKRKEVQSGDVVQIISNNYKKDVEIYNGDFAHILEVSPYTERISAPVWVERGFEKQQKIISLDFRKVTLKLDHYDTPFECLIIDSLLNSHHRELTLEEHKALYINFIMRFQKKHPNCKKYSQEFKNMLLNDEYMNAIRCKYGYAITCHKAQGGEWDKIIVDYTGRVSLAEEPLRWSYTATTRAVTTCYAVNPPSFNEFSKFEIGEIHSFTKIPKEAYNFDNVPLSPFHKKNQHRCKSKLYWDILEKLEDTDFKIKEILSRDYLERYTLTDGQKEYEIEGTHNGAGVFTQGFHFTSTIENDKVKSDIDHIFNSHKMSDFMLNYTPSNNLLKELYSVVQDACSELEITITNVVEHSNQYYVMYFFRTDTICSYIQFYFNSKEQFTQALPRAFGNVEDKKLEQLILKIEDYVV